MSSKLPRLRSATSKHTNVPLGASSEPPAPMVPLTRPQTAAKPLPDILEMEASTSSGPRLPLSSINKASQGNAFQRKNTRRSKSYTDLNHINKNKIDFKTLRKEVGKEKGSRNKAAVLMSTLSKAVPKPETTRDAGIGAQKRPAGAVTAGPSKPKLAKWDFKGRLNQQLEKNAQLQVEWDAMHKKLQGVELECEETLKKHKEIEELYINSKAKIAELELAMKQFEQTESRNRELESDLESVTSLYEQLKNDHEKCSKLMDELYELRKLKEVCANLEGSNANLRSELQSFQKERRVLHNIIQDLKGNIRVFCRVRPPTPAEENWLRCFIELKDETGIEIRPSRESINTISGKSMEKKTDFLFDRAFGPEATQKEIFEDLSQLVQSALDGYDVCVFAYGQTGSGKTYTMQGGTEPEHQGMIPRTIDRIFQALDALKLTGWEYQVQVSFLEIYNENIRDLLNINCPQKLEICFNEGRGTTVSNLTITTMKTALELKNAMVLAHRNRATAATNFNEHSSRSHAVTKIYLEGYNADQGIHYRGSINLVDLAGSENAKASTDGTRLTETKNINKSLAALANVLMALKSKTKHIPYRDSKLTFLLQSSLGGNSKTLMITNISPFEENYFETVSSLRFASKVKEVKTQTKRNKQLMRSNSGAQF